MRKTLATIAIALLVAAPGAAFAAGTTTLAKPAVTVAAAMPQSVTSTIKSLDLKNHSLTLANGIAYVLPATFKDPGLKVGEKVTVKWQMNGKAYDATSVTAG